MAEEAQISFDIRRSVILGAYIRHWGQPSQRTLSRKGQQQPVEVYEFPGAESGVYRVATVGVSAQRTVAGGKATWELLLSLPAEQVPTESEKIVHFVLDIMAYSLRSDVSIAVGATIPESPLAPPFWATKAILFDEPRAEPEDLAVFHIGAEHVQLYWLVPLFESERGFIKTYGLDAFDDKERQSEWSIIDVNRKPIV